MSTVVLLSGGMDSAICLAWAKERWAGVRALTVDYGQRHITELDSAKRIAAYMSVPWSVISCETTARSSLTTGEGGVVVPGRNLLLISSAAASNPDRIVLGACQADESGFPDCRRKFIDVAQEAVSLSLSKSVGVLTPLMYLTKCESLYMATKIPEAWEAIGMSMSCYMGTRCGECAACTARAKGFEDAGKVDPSL